MDDIYSASTFFPDIYITSKDNTAFGNSISDWANWTFEGMVILSWISSIGYDFEGGTYHRNWFFFFFGLSEKKSSRIRKQINFKWTRPLEVWSLNAPLPQCMYVHTLWRQLFFMNMTKAILNLFTTFIEYIRLIVRVFEELEQYITMYILYTQGKSFTLK